MSLKGTAQETVLELDTAVIHAEDGCDKVIEKLDKLYLKDATLEKFENLESFDSFMRKPNTTIQEHIHQFEKLYKKIKDKGTTMSDDLLAYKLLKSVQLSHQDEKIVKGTTGDLTLENMKTQLKKIFPDSGLKPTTIKDDLVPNEINEVEGGFVDSAETFYNSRRGGYRDYQGTLYQPRRPPNPPPLHYRFNSSNRFTNPRGRRYVPAFSSPRYPSPGRYPLNPRTGSVSQCRLCSSSDHFERDCPLKQRSSQSFDGHNVYCEELYQTNTVTQNPSYSVQQPSQQQLQVYQPQQSSVMGPPPAPHVTAQHNNEPQPTYFLGNEPTNETLYQVILFQSKELVDSMRKI